MNFISRQDERQPASRVEELVVTLKDLIRQARQQAVREVDRIQVRTCWIIGQRIVEFEQGGDSGPPTAKNSCATFPHG